MKSDKLTTRCYVNRSHWQDLLDCEDGNIYYFDDGMFKLRKTKDPGVTHCLKKKKKVSWRSYHLMWCQVLKHSVQQE